MWHTKFSSNHHVTLELISHECQTRIIHKDIFYSTNNTSKMINFILIFCINIISILIHKLFFTYSNWSFQLVIYSKSNECLRVTRGVLVIIIVYYYYYYLCFFLHIHEFVEDILYFFLMFMWKTVVLTFFDLQLSPLDPNILLFHKPSRRCFLILSIPLPFHRLFFNGIIVKAIYS